MIDEDDPAIPLRILERETALPKERIPPTAEEFLELLAVPSLISVKGLDTSRTRIVSTLLHGNEPSGLRAIQSWLSTGRIPAVNTLLFIGAVRTARLSPGFAHRFLPGRIDLNRCWFPPHTGRVGEFAGEVLRLFKQALPESLIDLHNNTGHNPPYGVSPRVGSQERNLVAYFADRVVHSPLRLGTLVEATQADFPSVTIECGCSGDPIADATALAGLERYLHDHRAEHLGANPPSMEVLTNPQRVTVREGVDLAFGEGPVADAEFTVARDIDRHNFERLESGVPIGWLAAGADWPIAAIGPDGRDVSRELFRLREEILETQRPLTPIMMTTNRRNALDDCLFYVVDPSE
jgi:hypothetical protein